MCFQLILTPNLAFYIYVFANKNELFPPPKAACLSLYATNKRILNKKW